MATKQRTGKQNEPFPDESGAVMVDKEQSEQLWNTVIENRGVNKEQWSKFCFSEESPFPDLPDMRRMLEELKNIHDNKKHISIFSHVDTDGIMSAVIAVAGLSELDFEVSLFDPDTSGTNRGYNITKEDIDNLVDIEGAYAALICDLAVAEEKTEVYRYAEERGLRLLVADHHLPENMDQDLFENIIYVNPWRSDPSVEQIPDECRDICGAGVVWLILRAYAQKYDMEKLGQINRLQAFAGIATIADLVSLSYISRRIVINSVQICREQVYGCGTCDEVIKIQGADKYRQAFQGLFYLIRGTENGLLYSNKDINESFYRKALIPLLNTPRDIGSSVEDDIYAGIFFAEEPPFEKIETLQEEREEYNAAVEAAYADLTPFEGSEYIWLYDSSAEQEGKSRVSARALAWKKTNETQKPTIVVDKKSMTGENPVGDDCLKGSMRSPDGIPLTQAINRAENEDIKKMLSVSGHDSAAGVTLFYSQDGEKRREDSQRISAFIEGQINACATRTAKGNPGESNADLVLAISEDNEEEEHEFSCSLRSKTEPIHNLAQSNALFSFLERTDEYAPYGKGFPPLRVEITLKGIKADSISVFGKEGKSHLKIHLFVQWDEEVPLELSILCYNQADMKDEINEHTNLLLRDGIIESEKRQPPTMQIAGTLQILS